MSLLRYFKPANRLPTADEAGLPTTVTAEVNKAVEKAQHGASKVEKSKKRKYTTAFTPEDRAAIGRYAAENVYLLSHTRCLYSFVNVVAPNYTFHHIQISSAFTSDRHFFHTILMEAYVSGRGLFATRKRNSPSKPKIAVLTRNYNRS